MREREEAWSWGDREERWGPQKMDEPRANSADRRLQVEAVRHDGWLGVLELVGGDLSK